MSESFPTPHTSPLEEEGDITLSPREIDRLKFSIEQAQNDKKQLSTVLDLLNNTNLGLTCDTDPNQASVGVSVREASNQFTHDVRKMEKTIAELQMALDTTIRDIGSVLEEQAGLNIDHRDTASE